jgi:hypothetical protein
MKSNAKCWTPQPAAPLIAMLWLTGCAMGASDYSGHVCPPVVEYDDADQARAAAELDMLPEAATRTERIVSKGRPDDWMTDTKGGKETFAASARWPCQNAKADIQVSFTREFFVPYKKSGLPLLLGRPATGATNI